MNHLCILILSEPFLYFICDIYKQCSYNVSEPCNISHLNLSILIFFQNIVAKFDIGNNRFVTVNEFKGQCYVHLREYQMDNVTKKTVSYGKGMRIDPIEIR